MDLKDINAALERFGPALAMLNPALAAARMPGSAVKVFAITQTLLDIGEDVKQAIAAHEKMAPEEDVAKIHESLAAIAKSNDALEAEIDAS